MTKEEKRFGLIQPDTEKGNHIFLKKILYNNYGSNNQSKHTHQNSDETHWYICNL